MWISMAVLAALLSGIAVVTSKLCTDDTDVYVVSALSNTVIMSVLILYCVFTRGILEISQITIRSYFLILMSGIAIGISWIFYYMAIKEGSVNLNMALDKFSIICTMILAKVFLNDKITYIMIIATVILILGTIFMIDLNNEKEYENKIFSKNNQWMIYALLAAFFNSLSTIFVKIDTTSVNSELTSALRYLVIAIMLWITLFGVKRQKYLKKVKLNSIKYIFCTGILLAFSYLYYFKALHLGNISVVMVLFKMSILISTIISYVFLKERLSIKGWIGFLMVVIGTIMFVV